MKRCLTVIISLWLAASAATAETATPTGNKSAADIRAVWLTTVSGLDWPKRYARDEASIKSQQQELTDMLDTLRRAGVNTVMLQTRVRGTVIYPSAIEPWDACMSGRAGVAPGYDPLNFAINECHKRGMELHAWIVTIPVGRWDSYGCRRMRKKYPNLVKQIDGSGYMNPENPLTGDIIAAVCAEIARCYDVDGIHLDYIRYPETWRIKGSKTKARANITSVVRKVHDAVRSNQRREIKLSCSPVGKYSDLSRYSSHGWNAFDKVCQDPRAWLRDGLMDQLYPMMYFKGNQFYPFAIDWMEHSYGKDIIAGLGVYFLDRRHGDWRLEEIKRQMCFARSLGMGVCFFRAQFVMENTQGLYDYLRYEHDYAPVLFNAMDNGNGSSQPTEGNGTEASADNEQQALNTVAAFPNDGNTMAAPPKGSVLDAGYIIFETLQGTPVAVKPFNSDKINISDIPDGAYFLRSVNRKGVTHRLGRTIIKRQVTI